jgi:SAM-dependent methyltransferase
MGRVCGGLRRGRDSLQHARRGGRPSTSRHPPGHAVSGRGSRRRSLSIPAARLGARVLATDFSPVMVARLDARAREEGLPNLESRVMDGHRLELEDGTFDVAGSQFGIMLFPDRPRALGELARVLRPGGHALMVVFGPARSVEAFAFLLRRRARCPSRLCSAARCPPLRPPGPSAAAPGIGRSRPERRSRGDGQSRHGGPVRNRSLGHADIRRSRDRGAGRQPHEGAEICCSEGAGRPVPPALRGRPGGPEHAGPRWNRDPVTASRPSAGGASEGPGIGGAVARNDPQPPPAAPCVR